MKFFTIISLLFLSVSANSQELPDVNSKKWTNKYDVHFRKYSKRFFGIGFDWKIFKAQAIAESNLKGDAESWVGAKGIMQIVPTTFEEIQSKNPSIVDINDPRWNIAAGIYYDSHLYSRWTDISTLEDRLKFTFASYNAGRRTMLNAQNTSRQEGFEGLFWKDIEAVAPKVPRWRHQETLGYIDKIFKLIPPKKK